MARLADVLANLKRQSWVRYSGYDLIARYVRDGGEAALCAIPSPGQNDYWTADLTRALHEPEDWTEEDRRLVHVIVHVGSLFHIWQWLNTRLAREPEGQDLYGIVARECKDQGSEAITASALGYLTEVIRNGHPTSFGRHLLALDLRQLQVAITRAASGKAGLHCGGIELVRLLLECSVERLDKVLPGILKSSARGYRIEIFKLLLASGRGSYEKSIAGFAAAERAPWERFLALEPLYEHAPQRYRAGILKAARAAIADFSDRCNPGYVAEWLASNIGAEVLPDLVNFVGQAQKPEQLAGMAKAAGTHMKAAALPIFDALLRRKEQPIRDIGVEQLIGLRDPAHTEKIEAHLRRGLTERNAEDVLRSLTLAQRWEPRRLMDALWTLLEHKSKPVRAAAVRNLAQCGDAAVEPATVLLVHKKSVVRLVAAELLTLIATEAALAALQARVDEEPSDEVRDLILLGLEAAWRRQGRPITKADIAARVERAADKFDRPVLDWLVEKELPPLKWSDGQRLTEREVRYLLYRQSRAREMRPDPEAAAVYALVDRGSSGPFAAAVLAAFLQSKQEAADRWVLTLAAMVGDDALVPMLVSQIRTWVDSKRGKLAEYAVQALALLGTDAALLAVDALSIRYRTKMKNVGRAAAESFALAAERQGLTPDELGDRVVPWLCFKPDEPRIITVGQTRFEVRIGADLKLAYRDLQKNKPVKSLPKNVPADVAREMKDVAANLREVVKAQTLRLENLLVRQRRWAAPRWRGLFLQHPVLLPFATRLVWGSYDDSGKLCGLFRPLEDRTLTTQTDEAYQLAEPMQVGLVHPLELDDETRAAWLAHLADYEIASPFSQLAREVVTLADSQRELKSYRELDGKSINGMTFKGRAERLGWHRGSVADAGSVTSYYKGFPAGGVDVLILLEGMFMGMDMYSEVTLGPVFFVRGGTVKMGSYTYDEPSGEEDPRVLSFGAVPPIVFSESMGDLRRIAGGRGGETE